MYARGEGDRKYGTLPEWLHMRIMHIYTRKLLLANGSLQWGGGGGICEGCIYANTDVHPPCVILGYSRIDLVEKRQL